MRDTSRQDRIIEPGNRWKRHGRLVIFAIAALIGLGVLIALWMRYDGAGRSVNEANLTLATVERGDFVRDVAADGQVVAAVSPTLYASAAGSVTLQVHAGDVVTKGQLLAEIDSPDL